jgi:hypothetical protein
MFEANRKIIQAVLRAFGIKEPKSGKQKYTSKAKRYI